ncbi:MAG: hypothetical protein EXS36_12590 [Pedosphaera sp.]|nr:hypothetical protein [Pedosphaera sp.]
MRHFLGLFVGMEAMAEQLTFGEGGKGAESVSPDGKWLTYNSDESGRLEVCVNFRPAPISVAE